MQDILTMLNQLRRPRLMIRAARHGAADYRRERHLQRLLGYGRLPGSGAALMRLIEMEAALEEQRRENDAAYGVTRHLDIMIAIMAEAALLRASHDRARA